MIGRSLIARAGTAGCLLFAGLADSGELEGRVVKIQDGDTLTVLVSRKQIKVRLAEIDTPERRDIVQALVEANLATYRRTLARQGGYFRP